MIFAAYIYCITHIGISIVAQATVLSMPGIVVPRFPHLRRISGEHRQKRTEKIRAVQHFPRSLSDRHKKIRLRIIGAFVMLRATNVAAHRISDGFALNKLFGVGSNE